MFENFPNQWTPVIPVSALTENPQAVILAGEPLVLFRDGEDQWHALRDHCPHRGARLSLGVVTAEGRLRCGYHGWRFNGAGECLAAPLNDLNAAALKKCGATAVPTRHIGGAIWVYTATEPNTTEVPEPQLSESLTGDPELFATYEQHWTAHWTRAQENFIDFAHPPYLHQATIGAWLHDYAEQGGTARVEAINTDFGMRMLSYIGDSTSGFELHWRRPNLSILHFGATPDRWLHVFCIPIDESHTRVMTVRKVRSAAELPQRSRYSSGTDNRILDEDRGIVESQRGDVLSDPGEISVATDQPTLVFRDWYRNWLAG